MYIHCIYINKEYNQLFEKNFKLTIYSKASRLMEYNQREKTYDTRLQKLNNIVLKKIIKINEVLPTISIDDDEEKRFVYDLTVETTRNFCTSNLLVCKDTFHLKIGFLRPYAEWDRQSEKLIAA
jgi:intein/homing endonuclease